MKTVYRLTLRTLQGFNPKSGRSSLPGLACAKLHHAPPPGKTLDVGTDVDLATHPNLRSATKGLLSRSAPKVDTGP
ncbi:MAG: hypothetical protein VB140_03175 [Burkholderia sp.]